MADGEWLSATMADFKNDHRLEIVHEDGRPSYFLEKPSQIHEPIDVEDEASNQAASKSSHDQSADSSSGTKAAVGRPVDIVQEKLPQQSSTPASSCTDEDGEVKILEPTRRLSYGGVTNEKGELINPFLDPSILC